MKKVFLAATLLLVSFVTQAQCNPLALKGEYSFGSGSYNCAVVGTLRFDANGTAKKSTAVMGCGEIQRLGVSVGRIQISTECVGNVYFSDGAEMIYAFDSQFKTAQISMLQDGIVTTGTLTKQ